MRITRRQLLIVAGFALLAFLVYGASLKNGFVIWDDDSLILENPLVAHLNWRTLWAAFTTYDPELYVPLTFLSFQFEHLFFGYDPFFYHLDNLLLHVLNALLVLALLRNFGLRHGTALFLAAMFLVHPLNTEAVAWASARKDVLCTSFLLASVLAFIRWRREGREVAYDFALLFALLAMLSKALAVMLPAGLLAVDLLRRHRWSRRDLLPYAAFILLSIIFLIVGLLGKQANIGGLTMWETLLLSAKAAAAYPLKLLWPADLSVVYLQTTPIRLASREFAVPLLACAVAAALAVSMLWRRQPLLAAGLCWYVAFLVPSFANFVKAGEVYALSDRYPYVAQIGLLLLAGSAIDLAWGRWRSTPLFLLAGAASIAIFGSMAHARSLIWNDSERLFRDALAKNDGSVVMHHNLGVLAQHRGDDEEAEHEFRRAIDIDPSYVDAHRGLAKILLDRGDGEGALAHMRIAVEVGPDDADALTGLAGLLLDRGDVQEAALLLERAVAIRPGLADAHAKLGFAYGKLGRYEEGIAELQEAQRLRDLQPR